MSMYRCAVCGSPNVQKTDQNEGFSYKKALVGTAVFGSVGVVAGINGKRNTVFNCPDCGNQSSLPMDDVNKNLVDTLMMLPSSVIEQTNSDLLRRYSYLKKEINQKKGETSAPSQNRLMNSFNSNNPFDITEKDFREAASLFYNTMVGHNDWKAPTVDYVNGKYYWHNSNFQPKPMDEYIAAYKALPIIYHGVPAYSHLIYDDADETGNGLSKYSIRKAILLYIFNRYGEMSCYDLYDTAMRDRFMENVFEISYASNHKYSSMNGLWKEWNVWSRNHSVSWGDAFLNMSPSVHSHYMKNEDRDIITLKLHLINGSLYTKGVSKEQQYIADHPEMEKEINDNHNSIRLIQSEIDSVRNLPDTPEMSSLKASIENIRREISKGESEIILLHKKIIGRKKAKQQAEQIEAKNTTMRSEIKDLEQQLEQQKSSASIKNNNKIQELIKTKEEAERVRIKLLEKKQKLIDSYSDLICYYGPDATVTPLNK